MRRMIDVNSVKTMVPSNGYRWATESELGQTGTNGPNEQAEDEDSQRLVLVVGQGVDTSGDPATWWNLIDRYTEKFPFRDDPAFFLNFAVADINAESVLKFANAFGNIFPDDPPASLADWRSASGGVLFWTRVWLNAEANALPPELTQFFERQPNGDIHFHLGVELLDGAWPSNASVPIQARQTSGINTHRPGDGSTWVVSTDGEDVIRKSSRPLGPDQYDADLMAAAREFLRYAINSRLRSDSAQLSIEQDPRDPEKMRFTARPRTLLGGIWAQFAAVLVKRGEFKKCWACGRFFMLKPGINRSTKMYCSNACRAKAARHRQAMASVLSIGAMQALEKCGFGWSESKLVEWSKSVLVNAERVEIEVGDLRLHLSPLTWTLDEDVFVMMNVWHGERHAQVNAELRMTDADKIRDHLVSLIQQVTQSGAIE